MSYLTPDAILKGLRNSFKEAVRLASTANINLVATVTTMDTVTLANEDRVLLKNQTLPAENGIYAWNSGTMLLTRTRDALTFTSGCEIAIQEGAIGADKRFQLITDNPILVGTTALVFAEIGGGGGGDLAATLAIGNITGGNDIVMTALDSITTPAGVQLQLKAADGAVASPGGNLVLEAGDGGIGTASGGNVIIQAGLGTGGGANGIISSLSPQQFDYNLTMSGDNTFLPVVDGEGTLGNAGKRFKEMRATIIVAGDLHLCNPEKGAHWVLQEEVDGIVVVNQITGKRYSMVLQEIT